MLSSPVQTDKSGQVTGVPHHDGLLLAMDFTTKGAIAFDLMDSSGSPHALIIRGCKYFIADGLREGNIIDRMFVWPLSEAPNIVYEDARKALSVTEIEMGRFAAEERKIFLLESVYGPKIFAIVDSVDWVRAERIVGEG